MILVWVIVCGAFLFHAHAMPTCVEELDGDIWEAIIKKLPVGDVCSIERASKRLKTAATLPALEKKTAFIQSVRFHSKAAVQSNLPLFMSFATKGILGDIHQQMWALEYVLKTEGNAYNEWISTIQNQFRLIPEMYHVCIRLIRESQSRDIQKRAVQFMKYLYSKGIRLPVLTPLTRESMKDIEIEAIVSNKRSFDLYRISDVEIEPTSPSIDMATVGGSGRNVDIEYGKDCVTELFLAASKGDVEAVNWLLQVPGIDVNKPSQNGWVSLMIAVAMSHAGVVGRLILEPGIDVNKESQDGETALIMASTWGEVEIAQMLLHAAGIDVNKQSQGGWTALIRASAEGRIDCVKILLAAPGIEVNQENGDGWTALMMASVHGHRGVVELFLKVPTIDVQKKSSGGETAFMMASAEGHSEIVELFQTYAKTSLK